MRVRAVKIAVGAFCNRRAAPAIGQQLTFGAFFKLGIVAVCLHLANPHIGKTILNGFKNFMLKGPGSWKRNLTLLFLIVHSIQKSEEEQRFYCEYLLKGPHSIWFIIMDSADDEKKLEV